MPNSFAIHQRHPLQPGPMAHRAHDQIMPHGYPSIELFFDLKYILLNYIFNKTFSTIPPFQFIFLFFYPLGPAYQPKQSIQSTHYGVCGRTNPTRGSYPTTKPNRWDHQHR